MKNYFYILFSISILAFSNSSFAYDDAFWEQMAKRSDVKITLENGVKTAHFSGGVTISDDGLGMDNSGKGAVRCSWEIYVAMKNMSELCFPDDESEFKKNLDYAVDKTNDFIIVNSLSPITKSEIEESIKRKFLELKEQISKISKEKFDKECSSGSIAQMKKHMMSKSPEEFRKAVDDVLSIPRPPVMNPCL
ncbi:MAG: hypothetical protein PHX61_03065 [Alphaproteobacteria bacterium]|nr:hypothetical protein [Alphaproteobacteria bacterium]